MGGILKRAFVAFGLFVLVPASAYAQAELSGVVRDTSGAVLPGVTVEAASPVLIERVRSAITDGNGRYVIADLRPGAYGVTFTLPGFRTIVRDGVELRGTAVTTINVELSVGAVEETITVTGETPVVNLQSTTRQAVMDQEIVSAIPSSRTPFTVGVLIPGVRRGAFMSQDVGGSVVQEVASLEANGGRTGDQRMMVNGVALSSMIAGGWGGGAVPNATGTAEFAIDVSAVDAQAATGGVRINFIPRDGGNRFSGTIFGSFATESFAADNYTGSDVQQRGLTVPNNIKGNGDFNPGAGGPILRDQLWFFASGRYLFANNYVAGMFHNQNRNQPDQFRYVPTNEQAVLHQEQQIYQLRLTWQASSRHKFGSTADFENFCACTTGISALVAPEAGNDRRFPLQRFVTLDWTSPVSNRLLLEASGIHRVERWGGMHPQVGKQGNISSLTPGIVSITDNPSLFSGASLTYRSAAQFNNSWNWNIHYRAAASYITGSHNFKIGFNNAYGYHDNTTYSHPAAPYSYNFANGNPSQIVYRAVPRTIKINVDRDLGIFAQDRWTLNRLTLMGAIRYDTFASSFPEQGLVGTFFGRSLNAQFQRTSNVSWHDVTPRIGATYDLFGNGRTAIKGTINRYLEGLGTTGIGPANVAESANPINRLNLGGPGVVFRTWNDQTTFPAGDPRNGNFVPDCDLNNFTAHGECGAVVNGGSFGQPFANTNFDPNLITGWGKRAYNWELTASIQQEIVPRVSAEVQYARRWYGNFRLMQDTAVSASDYERFTINVPTDSRLPNSGGTLTGFDLTSAANARPASYLVTHAKNFGKMSEVFDGVNLTINARTRTGVIVQGGLGTGRVVTDDCEVVAELPEMLHTFVGNPTRNAVFAARTLERCKQNNGWRTQFQGLASYTIPRVDVNIAGTFQNLPGAAVSANASVASTCNTPAVPPCTPDLNRAFAAPFFGGRFFNIVEAGQLFVERLNQIDFRVSKIFRMAGTRTNINFDFYNVLNANSVIGENFTYVAPPSTTWRTPQSILLPRLFKISAQFDF